MRTRLGAHVAGLLAAAGGPLELDDLRRLTGRSRASIAALLPTESSDATSSIGGIELTPQGWTLTGADAVGHVVRGLYTGTLPDGAEAKPAVRERALAPFRGSLLAVLASAREEWGWESAPAFALGTPFVRSMAARLSHPEERTALVRTVTDPARIRVLSGRQFDAPREQLQLVARTLAQAAASTADLVDLAAVLLSEASLDETGGAVPRRLPPVYALLGDVERSVELARHVRTDVTIELAYVARAIAQATGSGGEASAADELAVEAIAGLGEGDDAPAVALLRTARAVAGVALYLPPGAACRRAGDAHALVERAFDGPPQPETVEGLRSRQFRASRDQERALAATTLATSAVAFAQAGDEDGARLGIRSAAAHVELIADDSRRAVAWADVAVRLAVCTSPVAPALLADAAATAATNALAAAPASDVDALAQVARLLSGGAHRDGDSPEAPALADRERAADAARRALGLIATAEALPPRGALTSAAEALFADDTDDTELALLAARRAVQQATGARYGSVLQQRTRARLEAVVLAEAAAVLDAAGEDAEAKAAADAALVATGRVAPAARARPLGEVAATLLDARSAAVIDVALAAAGAERTGTEGRWDATAPARIADAALRVLARATEHSEAVADVLAQCVLALRRGEHAGSLTTLADTAIRQGMPQRAAELAVAALRAAGARDPIRARRAEAALAELDEEGTVTTPVAFDVPATAAAWLADGYPTQSLAALAQVDPAAARKVAAGIRRDLTR
ncbi:MAG: hypothetical protein QM677_02130 [Microbacterium sp.]